MTQASGPPGPLFDAVSDGPETCVPLQPDCPVLRVLRKLSMNLRPEVEQLGVQILGVDIKNVSFKSDDQLVTAIFAGLHEKYGDRLSVHKLRKYCAENELRRLFHYLCECRETMP